MALEVAAGVGDIAGASSLEESGVRDVAGASSLEAAGAGEVRALEPVTDAGGVVEVRALEQLSRLEKAGAGAIPRAGAVSGVGAISSAENVSSLREVYDTDCAPRVCAGDIGLEKVTGLEVTGFEKVSSVMRWPTARTLAAALVLACSGGCGAQHSRAADGAPASAARPPDFELPTLAGGSERLSDHFGRDVVLLDFWATYCEPCLRAMPGLNALYEKYSSRGFVVLGISIDAADALPEVRAEVKKLRITFPILLDQETRVVGLYNPKTSAPFSVLIARTGAILHRKEGYTTGTHADLERDIQAALEER